MRTPLCSLLSEIDVELEPDPVKHNGIHGYNKIALSLPLGNIDNLRDLLRSPLWEEPRIVESAHQCLPFGLLTLQREWSVHRQPRNTAT